MLIPFLKSQYLVTGSPRAKTDTTVNKPGLNFWYGDPTQYHNRTMQLLRRPDGDLKVWPGVRWPKRHEHFKMLWGENDPHWPTNSQLKTDEPCDEPKSRSRRFRQWKINRRDSVIAAVTRWQFTFLWHRRKCRLLIVTERKPNILAGSS